MIHLFYLNLRNVKTFETERIIVEIIFHSQYLLY